MSFIFNRLATEPRNRPLYVILKEHRTASQDGVIAYPVMQVHGSLPLDDHSEVGEDVLVVRSISCIYISTIYHPAKETGPQLAGVLLGEDLVIFPCL